MQMCAHMITAAQFNVMDKWLNQKFEFQWNTLYLLNVVAGVSTARKEGTLVEGIFIPDLSFMLSRELSWPAGKQRWQ